MITRKRVLPREIAPGIYWLGDCLELPHAGQVLHSCDSVYLVRGEEASLLVEAGLPGDHAAIDTQLDELVPQGSEVRYIWATHQETAHAGGIGRLLSRFPNAQFVGNTKDFHLFFPQYEDRFVAREPGDSIDLGGTEFVILDALIKDLITTQWGFDTARRVLFPGDGFSYAHYHNADQCGCTAEEVPTLDIQNMGAFFTDVALTWTRYTEMDSYATQLERLVQELPAEAIGPTHGLPILDVPRVLPEIIAGLRDLADRDSAGSRASLDPSRASIGDIR